ncbi:MAG: bifunctional tetrahydrofolate synthase/dihydrofolate synthase [Gammaproteobacteria bacterium]|nr:bifunctional tetrahydrofolate synthase/dihydrofolate synthase [Gammaproteobacteria bacterium]
MRFNHVQAWLDWQLGLHATAIDLGLERVRQVYDRLAVGKPAPVVFTVAGTNGKGSTVAMLRATLLAAGYRVGCYTSPHVLRYNERISINHQQVEDAALCEAFERVDQARGEISLTFFEFGTLAALDIFARSALDVVVLETGLGGRLDAVNIIDADVAIITSIDMDHMDWLGDTREKIALEKMGIGRAGAPLVIADPSPPELMLQQATAAGMQLRCLGQDYGFVQHDGIWDWWGSAGEKRLSLPLPNLRGVQQLYNASAVLQALSEMKTALPLSQSQIREGLQSIVIPARFEIRQDRYRLILDVAHNPQAGEFLARNLRSLHPLGAKRALLGMMRDKNIADTLKPLLPLVGEWYLTNLPEARAASAEEIRDILLGLGVAEQQLHCFRDANDARHAAELDMHGDDILLVFGSFFTLNAFLQAATHE